MAASGRIGFRLAPSPPQLPDAQLRKFDHLGSSNLADAMGRFHFMDPGIRSRTALRCSGAAVTVNCRPGDNLMVHKALDVARPGEILVVSTNGGMSTAVFGELMCHTAVAKRLGGVVV